MNNPRVFIGSAAESINYVNAVQDYLDHTAEVTPWTSAFDAQQYPMDDLEEQLETNDFAVFILSPDDIVKMRDVNYKKTRDNSLFELGLFWGRLGRERVFFLHPDSITESDYKLPSDFTGLTTMAYKKREDGNIKAAVSKHCGIINEKIVKLGKLKKPEVELMEELERTKTETEAFIRATFFYTHLTDKLFKGEQDKIDILSTSFNHNYKIPDELTKLHYSLDGTSIWEASSEGISQVAGNVGIGGHYDFDVEYQSPIMVIECYKDKKEKYTLYKDSGLTKTYLICYHVAKKFVLTVHISGSKELSQEHLDSLTDYNYDVIAIVQRLLNESGGGEQ